MATLVGTQIDFENALKDLVELDYDAVEAYEAAVARLENSEFREKLNEFMEDHKRHIKELSALLKEHDATPPDGPDMTKQWLAKGKVILSNMLGDKSILSAMSSNETDTVTAYDRILNRDDKWEDAVDILKRGLEDEKKHKAWLEINK